MPEALIAHSVSDALARGSAVLAEAGCESPRLDAELLLGEALAVNREQLVLDGDRAIDSEALKRFHALLARRSEREPVAYILRRKHFRRIRVSVDPRVLIPRPESELLVEVGLSLPHGARVVDVGTGSGAVALALKDERPDLEVWGTDVSADSVVLARENARALALEVRFSQADLLEYVTHEFDAVLANLPYVEDGAPLEPEISRYEPHEALFAGADGLDVIRRLVGTLPSGPRLLALEVGAGQAAGVATLLEGVSFRSIEVVRDLAGIERVVVGSR